MQELFDVFLSFNPVKQLSFNKKIKRKKSALYLRLGSFAVEAIPCQGQWALCQVPACPWVAAAAAAAKSLQSCPTLCDPIDGLLPGSSVPGILQARTLEWVAISFSNA